MTTADQMHGLDPIAEVPPGFVDAVMRSVAAAPLPSPTRAFTSALQDRSTSEAQGALSVAWRLIRAGATMPVLVRAQALALLLIVGGSVASGGALAAVATYQTVVPIIRSVVDRSAHDARMMPQLAEPSPTPRPSLPPSPTPAVTPAADDEVVAPNEPASDGVNDDHEVAPDAEEEGDDTGTDDPDDGDEPDSDAADPTDDADDASDDADHPDGEADADDADDSDS